MEYKKLKYLLAAAGVALLAPAAAAFNPTVNGGACQTPKTPFHRPMQKPSYGMKPAPVTALRSFATGPTRKTAGGTTLYGYLTAGHGGNDHGLYEFNEQGFTKVWSDPLWNPGSYSFSNLQSGWYKDGKLCGFDHWFEYGYFWGQLYYEIDFNTGEIVKELEDEDCIDVGWFINGAYDSDNDIFYGYGTDDEDEASTALFMKTSGSNPFQYEIIKDYGKSQQGYSMQCISMCYNPVDKKLYGINLNKQFVTINPADGTQTLICDVPVNMGLYVTGLVYSPAEGVFYWNCNYDNTDGSWGSDLYTINAATHEFTKVDSFEGGPSFQMLFNVGDNVNFAAPKRPELKEVNFSPGSTSGTIVYTMPTQNLEGGALGGTLTYKATIDGRLDKSGTFTPGQELTIEVDNVSDGNHEFGISGLCNGAQGPELVTKLYVGADRPMAPKSVTLSENLIRWAPVTEGVNGGYLDKEKLEYEVYLNGQLLTTTKRNSYDLTIPAVPAQRWTASVVAVCDGKRSTPTYSNEIVAGEAWKMPYRFQCTEENLGLAKIFNVNNDDETWTYTDWEEGYYSGQVDEGTGDDWIIFPAAHFDDASKNYSFYIDCMSKAKIYPDTWLEVYYGEYPEPDMMTGVIMQRFHPESRDYRTYGNPMFKVPEAGDYYIGVRCITNQGQLGCIISEIRVEDNDIAGDSPKAASDITATAGENGALSATVTFTMPDKTVGGATIDASKTLTAVVTGVTESTVTGHPGEQVSATVGTIQGDNTIYVQVNDGNVSGERATVTVYTGVSIPGTVRNLSGTVSEDMLSMAMTWEAPEADRKPGYVDPATVEYFVGLYDERSGSYDLQSIGMGVTSYTFTLPANAQQDIYQVGVQARNAAGDNDRLMVLRPQMGRPYALPMNDDFETQELAYQPWVQYKVESSQYDVNWALMELQQIATDWAGNYNVALIGYCSTENVNAESLLGLPRFSTEGQTEVTVKIKYYAGAEAANLKLQGSVYSSTEPVELHNFVITGVDSPDEWKTAEVKLPADMLGRKWVQLYLDALFSQAHNYTIIDSIEVAGDNSGLIAVVDAKGSVNTEKGAILVNGFDGETARVFTTGGLQVAERNLDGTQTRLPLAPGIYLLTIGETTWRLIVK